MTYDRGDGTYLGGPNGIRVVSYHLQGDGEHAPLVGRIVRRTGRFEIHTDDGKRFSVRGDRSQLDAVVGQHIWLLARWHDGAMEPLRIGLLGPQR